jgi:hypothetical protein
MTPSDFGTIGAGAAAVLTVLWAVMKDRRSERRSNVQEDASSATAAFAGFEGLVSDLRKDLVRLRAERDDDRLRSSAAEARQVARELILNAEIDRLRREVELLRAQLAAVGQGRPGRDGADGVDGSPGHDGRDGAAGVNGTNGTNGLNGVRDRNPTERERSTDTQGER